MKSKQKIASSKTRQNLGFDKNPKTRPFLYRWHNFYEKIQL